MAGAEASATVRLADLVSEMRRQGAEVLDFTAGRPVEPTPKYICDVAVSAMLAGDTHQTMAQGTPEYREAIARKLERDNGIAADPQRTVMATMGAKHGLTMTLLATLDPGDEVLIEDPCFVSYGPTIRVCGGVARGVPLLEENGFRWTREQLEGALSARTRVILYCSPHNPAGTVHTDEDLELIADIARRRDLLLIADETYERIAWAGRRHVSMASRPGMAERTITLMGLTKAFAMGGWRVGFLHAPETLIAAMLRLQQHLNTCVGSFAQAGAAHALRDEPPKELRDLWSDWERRCEFAATELNGIDKVSCRMPEGGFYGWIDARALGEGSVELSERLLKDHGVGLVPGVAFGPTGEGFLRMTCVRPWEELRDGIERLKKALA